MNIGIIVHSQTGRTARSARALQAALSKLGHHVSMELLRTTGRVAPRSTAFEISAAPAVDGYDLIVLGAPVWAFAASPVIMKYIRSSSGRLSGKKALCFVTKGLPFRWTGGVQALAAMSRECAAAGAQVLPGEIIGIAALRSEAGLQPPVDRMAAACAA